MSISKGLDFGNGGYHNMKQTITHMEQILSKWQLLYLTLYVSSSNVGSNTDYSDVPRSFSQPLDENIRSSLKLKKA
jgi:hypothetical protein